MINYNVLFLVRIVILITFVTQLDKTNNLQW